MGLKLNIFIFLVALFIANMVVFLFIRGVDIIDRLKFAVFNAVHKYVPIEDPLIAFLLVSLIVIVVIGLVLVRIFGK